MITISTFNIQNDIKNYSQDKVDTIIKYLKDNKIDILALQEVYSTLNKDLDIELEKINYTNHGKYRYLLKKIFNIINEKTPIITDKKVIEHKTIRLPILPSLLKRIVTRVVVEIDGKTVSIYNTHLDYKYDIVKKRQLKKILKLIKKDNNPIILMGDFNLKTNKKIFLDFIEELKKININHIDIKDKTFKASKYHRAIDHIFLSDDFKCINKKLITNISISDHFPILLSIDFK